MSLVVDTGGLAVLRAEGAVLALISVEVDLQPRETGKERKDGAYRADGVAVGASASPCQYEKHYEGDGSDDEYRQ